MGSYGAAESTGPAQRVKRDTVCDSLPWVNPLSITLWDQTRLLKAWQRGVTWPKTSDCSAMASPAPQGAPASVFREEQHRYTDKGQACRGHQCRAGKSLGGHMSAHDTRVTRWSCAFPGSTSSYTNMRG